MDSSSRREFLRDTALAAGALALGGRAFAAEEPVAAAAQPAEGPLQMAVAKWGGDAVEESGVPAMSAKLTKQAIESLGGMQRFVSKGDVVWVKPNIGWNRGPEYAANTNPDVVGTLVELCLNAGAKTVKVGDNTCNSARQCYTNSGIAAAVEKAGGQVVYLDESRFRDVELKGERLKSWPLYPEIIETDLVINVPITKHHGLSKATLCMKNYMGVIGGRRNVWHQDIEQCLVDITAYMKPPLCVLDAVRTLTAGGPVGGNLDDVARKDTVAAGTDIVALDALGAELLGHQPGALSTITSAAKAGLGTADYRTLRTKEIGVS